MVYNTGSNYSYKNNIGDYMGKIYTTIEIVKGFEEDEVDDLVNILSKHELLTMADGEKYVSEEMKTEKRILSVEGDLTRESLDQISDFLKDLGIPFKARRGLGNGILIFDGVRLHDVYTNEVGEPLTLMSNMREVLDLLETTEEEDPYADMKALVAANAGWIDVNINNMWRYGMENSVAFSSNDKEKEDVIDVEIEEEDGGSPEITAKINN